MGDWHHPVRTYGLVSRRSDDSAVDRRFARMTARFVATPASFRRFRIAPPIRRPIRRLVRFVSSISVPIFVASLGCFHRFQCPRARGHATGKIVATPASFHRFRIGAKEKHLVEPLVMNRVATSWNSHAFVTSPSHHFRHPSSLRPVRRVAMTREPRHEGRAGAARSPCSIE